MKLPIYMDNHATTPVDPRALERMLPFFTENFGNAASRSHVFGWKAEEAVEVARTSVAKLMGATGREIVFTSGATESNNLAIIGVAEAYASKGNHIVTQVTEHKAVLDVCRRLENRGAKVTYLPVDSYGRVDPEAVKAAISDKTILVSLMAANNEIGTIEPLAEIGVICRQKGVLFHTDAAQAYGKIPLDVETMCLDLVSISAHKLYGPKGVGALYVRRKNPRVQLAPIIYGGGHERGLRSGTLNVPGVVGLGAAAEIAANELAAEAARVGALRDRLRDKIIRDLDKVQMNGHPTERLPGNLNLTFSGIEAEALTLALKDVALSTGSACTSATLEPSHVLRAIGGDRLAAGSVRFGLGRFNTEEEVDYVAGAVVENVQKLRSLAGRGR